MPTQLFYARAGKITEEMQYAAAEENTDADILRQMIAEGSVIIPANINPLQPT